MHKNKKIDEANLRMDLPTYTKIKTKLSPKDTVTITGDKPMAMTAYPTKMEENDVIEPQDIATLKYLSNVIDDTSGEVSKPFSISDKRYQMVRAMNPDNQVVLGVYCFDDVDDAGDNIVHDVNYFEENVAKSMKEALGIMGADIQSKPKIREFDYASAEREFHDKEELMNYLNLTDINPEYKHFFVNIDTGEIMAKFKSTKEMIKSGVKLGPNEDYMDLKALKRFRFGDYFKPNVSEQNIEGTDVPKLQADVKKLANLIKTKFSIYLAKLDKPIEQAQFLTAMATEIGVPLNKLSTIINTYKDIAKGQVKESVTTNKKTKNIIKVKDLRNE